MSDMNAGFWDLDPQDRGAIYDKAERETGESFWDLSPEDRGYYYERAWERDGNYEVDRD